MKTAMQTIIGHLKELERLHKGDSLEIAYGHAVQHAEDLLEKEKQQIVDAYGSGFDDGIGGKGTWIFQGSEHYYNETYS